MKLSPKKLSNHKGLDLIDLTIPFRPYADTTHVNISELVAKKTKEKLGEKWVSTSLKIAKIESSFNCGALGPHTKGGRGRGIFQVMPGSAKALGYSYSRLSECEYGIDAGLAHMEKCLSVNGGDMTTSQMASCHVSGWGGFDRRLKKYSETYRNKYIYLAKNAKI